MRLRAELRRGDFSLDVELEAGPGVTALFGPSGAGKTTVARLVAGLEPGARVEIGGRDVSALPPHRRGIGYVFQEPRLLPHLSVRQNLLYGAPRGADPVPTADMLGIAPLLDRRPRALSGGEAARVALGRALLRAPRMLILDEPLAALDAARRLEILPHFERLRGAGLPILLISHAIEEVARLADTLVLMRAGRIERAGPLAEVLGDPASAALIGPAAAGAVIEGVVGAARHDLAPVGTPAGVIWVPATGLAEGARVRLRLPASDIIVAVEPPRGLSALNVLPATIEAIHEGGGPGAMLGLRAGGARLLARVTQRSVEALDLAPGRAVWAVVKATGVARADVGGG
ncbi:molybdenum ABC transporter ATP-binding protein [Jannaschia sp. W003]|uniref:molybdenum ABC transporter ATP-binding protein n=1 Tax=Jannaschia sp. W003 TaxID=2867012 RepID=UPI0021A6FDBF|nr:molybdenum ABC transporter ATP-binding protein [Jannaschia sp. W003]UWQ20835.1 molybdenum ABC transporter ATP-binding protein [Jannaschia sp. W003]